ncbi:hypothetical protein [Thermoflavimicrobium daqui]|uniref:Uncharacterized protein n=1 Tax=Thermoflavimicrobium daqui TaxID=2137476 RepID=A0A364K8U0_9BACL|nr:hypothetical protein [Thermoflavimicrobium daqui]RAL26711.1 hypothetical protein DL897_01275 [Thermoflavimicrobium daqui]
MTYAWAFHDHLSPGGSKLITHFDPIPIHSNSGLITFGLFDIYPSPSPLEVILYKYNQPFLTNFISSPGTIRFYNLSQGYYDIVVKSLRDNVSFVCHISNEQPYVLPNYQPITSITNKHIQTTKVGTYWVNGLTPLQVSQGTVQVYINQGNRFPYQIRVSVYRFMEENPLYYDCITDVDSIRFSKLTPGLYELSVKSLIDQPFIGTLDVYAY